MLEPDMNLSELFGDNDMKMQSSMIYRALRGEGMRVTPLVGNKVTAEPQKLVVPNHMVVSTLKQKAPNKPGTMSSASASKTAYVGKIFDLRANSSNDGGFKVPAIEYHPTSIEPTTKVTANAPTTTKVVMEFKKRDVVTPVSAASTQRVPFTSTKLEKYVSRESLKEEESDKKPKPQRKPAASKMAGRKTSLVSKDLPDKSRFTNPRSRIPYNSPQRLSLYKHRKVNVGNKKVTAAGSTVQGKITSEQTHTAKKTLPGSAPKENLKTVQRLSPGSAQKPPETKQRIPTRSSRKTTAKQLRPGCESKTDFPRKAASRKSVGVSDTTATGRRKADSLGRKLWIPTSETVESWNQYCPASKVRAPRKRKVVKRRPVEIEEEKSVASKTVKSDFDEESDDESTEIDEEERKRLRDLEIRRDIEQRSVEFFNQFKYGEILRNAIPKMRFNPETRPDNITDARLSDVEIKMRLSKLNESASRINELIPRWSSLLMTTRETNRVEEIRKTLTNAQHILDRKVDRAKEMLAKYIDTSGQSIPSEEMEDIKRHSELVQLDMNSLERMFAAHEKQLASELDEPTSISP